MKTSTKIILITAIVIIVAGTWAYREKTECLQKAKTENKISVPIKKTKTIYSGKKSKTIETVTSANGITEIISEKDNISPEKHTARKTTIIKSPDGKIISTRINTAETDGNTKKITDDNKSQYSRTIKIREEKNSENPKTNTVINTEKTITPNGNIIESSVKKTTITNGSDEKTTEKITTIDGKIETNEYTSTQGPNNTKDSITKSVTTQNGEVKRFLKITSMGSKGLDTIFEETVSPDGKTREIRKTIRKSNNKPGQINSTSNSTFKIISQKKGIKEVTLTNRTFNTTILYEGGNKGKTIKLIMNTKTTKGNTIKTSKESLESTKLPNGKITRDISKSIVTIKTPKKITETHTVIIEDGIKQKHTITTITIDGKTKKTVTQYYTPCYTLIWEKTKVIPYKTKL